MSSDIAIAPKTEADRHYMVRLFGTDIQGKHNGSQVFDANVQEKDTLSHS